MRIVIRRGTPRPLHAECKKVPIFPPIANGAISLHFGCCITRVRTAAVDVIRALIAAGCDPMLLTRTILRLPCLSPNNTHSEGITPLTLVWLRGRGIHHQCGDQPTEHRC